MNEAIMQAAGFGDRLALVKQGKCPLCAKEINFRDFKDMLSAKEFEISGMCQACQDETFAEPEEDTDPMDNGPTEEEWDQLTT